MTDVLTDLTAFVDACETGKGWEGCAAYCTPDATFLSQAGAIKDITTLAGYCDWMQGLLGILPDGSYAIDGMALDADRKCLVVSATFTGTHTGEGGPVAATSQKTASDYVYRVHFDDAGKVTHMVKIWNDNWALAELGWA